MNVDLPPEEFRALAAPLFERAAEQVCESVAAAARAFAQDAEGGYWDKERAAQYLGIKVRALEDWMEPVVPGTRGRGLPHFKFGGTVRFKRSRIDAWALTQEMNRPAISLLEEAA